MSDPAETIRHALDNGCEAMTEAEHEAAHAALNCLVAENRIALEYITADLEREKVVVKTFVNALGDALAGFGDDYHLPGWAGTP